MQAPGVQTRDPSTQACFGAGTLVHTLGGQVPIELIQLGDLVLGQSETGGKLAYNKVVNTAVFEDRRVMLLQYVLANENLPRSLSVTGNHPFWVQDLGWCQTRELKAGQRLQLVDDVEAYVVQTAYMLGPAPSYPTERTGSVDNNSSRSAVAATGRRPLRARAFSIELEDFHTYFVGEAGVWVRNGCVETTTLAPVVELRRTRKG